MIKTGEKIDNKYEILKFIGTSEISDSFLVSSSKKEKYVLKIFKQEYISTGRVDFLRFENEFASIKKIKNNKIIKIIDYGTHNGLNYIVTEFSKGEKLYQIFKNEINISFEKAVDLIYQVTAVIKDAHESKIIHRDISSENIYYIEETNEIHIGGFGLYHLKEFNEIKKLKKLSHIFGYISPEIYGLIGSNVNERSDLYSIGILFYRLITGRLPYETKDFSVLLYQLLTKEIELPSEYNSQVPPVVDRMIMKLLSTYPGHRYQSADGLLNDLKQLKNGDSDFEIAEFDVSGALIKKIPYIDSSNLIPEIEKKLEVVKKGKGAVVLIEGGEGLGATRLLEEIYCIAKVKSCTYGYTRCFSEEKNIPLSAVKNGMKSYIRRYNSFPEERKNFAKANIKDYMGAHLHYLHRLLPDFYKTLGFSDEDINDSYSDLSDSMKSVYLESVLEFFGAISEMEKGSVYCIDDLHSADGMTFDLVKKAMTYEGHLPVLILCIYKSEELKSCSKLKELVDFAINEAQIEKLTLKPMSKSDIEKFVRYSLKGNVENLERLVNLLYIKSMGNPLFSKEILNNLINDYVLKFKSQKWIFDENRFNLLHLPDSVVDIILQRLNLLNRDEKYFLSYLAVISKPVDVNLIVRHGKFESEKVMKLISSCISLQLIEYVSSDVIYFVHSKIKRSMYATIDPDTKKQLHNEVGLFLEKQNINKANKEIFEIMGHFIQSGNEEKIGEYSMIAGAVAGENFSYENAIMYYELGRKYVEAKNGIGSSKWFLILDYLSKSYFLSGKNDEAIKTLNEKLNHVKDNEERSLVLKDCARVYFKLGDFLQVESNVIDALKELDVNLGLVHEKTRMSLFPGLVNSLLFSVLSEKHYLKLFAEKDPDKIRKNKIIVQIIEPLLWVYFYSKLNKYNVLMVRLINFARRHIGCSKEYSLTLRFFSCLYMIDANFKPALKHLTHSMTIEKSLLNQAGIAQSNQMYGLCRQWMGAYEESIRFVDKSINELNEIGNKSELAFSYTINFYNHFFLGNYIEAMEYVEKYKLYAEKSKDDFGIVSVEIYEAKIRIEKGETDAAEKILRNSEQLCIKKNFKMLHCILLTELGTVYLIERKYRNALEIIKKAEKIYLENNLPEPFTINLYVMLAEAFLKEYRDDLAGSLIDKKEKRKVFKKIKIFSDRALKIGKKWNAFLTPSLRLHGFYNALKKRNFRAEKYFRKSIKVAAHLGRKYELGRAYYDYGIFLSVIGRHEDSQTKLEMALKLFTSIDSKIYMTRTMALLNYSDKKNSMQRLMDKERLDFVINTGQRISTFLNMDEIIDYIADRAVETVNAQRIFIFLYDKDKKKLSLKKTNILRQNDEIIIPQKIADECLNTKVIITNGNAVESKEFASDFFIKKYNVKSFICVPIMNHSNIAGVCYLDNPLISDIFTKDDFSILELMMNQAAIAIENAHLYMNLEAEVEDRTSELNDAYKELTELYRDLKDRDDELAKDLDLAQKVQQSMMPHKFRNIEYLKFSINYMPMSAIGGDLYDIYEVEKGKVRIFIADATGHGVQAALVTMIIKSEFERLKRNENISDILQNLNNILIENYTNVYVCFTCFFIEIDYNRKMISYCSAGHPEQILIQDNKIFELKAKGRLLGVLKDEKYDTEKIKISEIFKIFLFTDGIFEQFNENNDEFGIERMISIIEKHQNMDIKDILKSIASEITEFMKKNNPDKAGDDITLIGVECDKGSEKK